MPSTDPNNTSKNDDLLAELRAKTAELAKSVKGKDEPKKRTLEVESDESNDPDSADEMAVKQSVTHAPQGKATEPSKNHAVEMVRSKLSRLYAKEPDAGVEAERVEELNRQRSPHQEFMHNLTNSGKSLADIQTQWHEYYTNLPDNEKHVVWKEFYSMQQHTSEYAKSQMQKPKLPARSKMASVIDSVAIPRKSKPDNRSVVDVKAELIDRVNAGGKLKPIHHFKSLLFGLGLASVVGMIITFTFFNEVFVAPFISPSQNVSATPIIGNSGDVGPESKIIIPKINVEVPVVFELGSIEEDDIQDALEDGVVHYATTPNPGEIGNSVIVGHSSNNILNAGKYKFAFVLLNRLENEDIFYVQRGGVRYTYKIYKTEIVQPTEVSVLDTQERANTITLITCDPPGTSINRLIITAEQIDPDPASNSASTAPPLEDINGANEEEALPSNAPSLWSRIWPF